MLNGYKIVIKGNHDMHEKKMLEAGFDEFYKEYDYKMPDGRLALLKHYPMPDCLLDKKYDLLIHGHIHMDKKVNGKKINVSTDIWNYFPIGIDTLCNLEIEDPNGEEMFSARINKSGMLEINCKIRMEDFSGANDYVYRMMYRNREEK